MSARRCSTACATKATPKKRRSRKFPRSSTFSKKPNAACFLGRVINDAILGSISQWEKPAIHAFTLGAVCDLRFIGLVAASSARPTRAETQSSDTLMVVPLDFLPSYGSQVSAWHKQRVYDPSGNKVRGTVADMAFSPSVRSRP